MLAVFVRASLWSLGWLLDSYDGFLIVRFGKFDEKVECNDRMDGTFTKFESSSMDIENG